MVQSIGRELKFQPIAVRVRNIRKHDVTGAGIRNEWIWRIDISRWIFSLNLGIIESIVIQIYGEYLSFNEDNPATRWVSFNGNFWTTVFKTCVTYFVSWTFENQIVLRFGLETWHVEIPVSGVLHTYIDTGELLLQFHLFFLGKLIIQYIFQLVGSYEGGAHEGGRGVALTSKIESVEGRIIPITFGPKPPPYLIWNGWNSRLCYMASCNKKTLHLFLDFVEVCYEN